MVLLAVITYAYFKLDSNLISLNLRHTELMAQSDLYANILHNKASLDSSVSNIQQDLKQYFVQQAASFGVNKNLTEAWYLSQIVALAQAANLLVISCDPTTRTLSLEGNFQQLINWLGKLQNLESEHFCAQLLINKTPGALHIDYMYDMHTLAELT